MHVQVSSEQVGDATVVRVAGELDLHTSPALQTELETVMAARPALVVVDLSKVDFMDSTGLSAIVAVVAAARDQDAQVRVVTATDKITKLFTLTGVDKQVGLFGTAGEALDA